MLRRIRLADMRLVPGDVALIPPDRLAVAATLVESGAGRPHDQRTARDVALWRALRAPRRPDERM